MPRFTQEDRFRLRKQLMYALAPSDYNTRKKLEFAAFDALITDYYTPAGLKRLRAMPAEWFEEISHAFVTPTGERLGSTIRGAAQRLPRRPPNDYKPGTAAQAAIDRWHTHVEQQAARERTIGHRVDTVLEASASLAAVLVKLPEARDILQLPPAADVAASAAEINAALKTRKRDKATGGAA